MQRKVAACINCQEEREIAAHGLCFKCYRAQEREADNPYAAADRHNRAHLKQLKKLRKCSNAILNALDDGIDVFNPEDVDAVRRILQPYFVSLAAGLAPVREKVVNSEQNEKNDVHCSQSEAVVENSVNAVNSEQVNGVQSSQLPILRGAEHAVFGPSSDDLESSNVLPLEGSTGKTPEVLPIAPQSIASEPPSPVKVTVCPPVLTAEDKHSRANAPARPVEHSSPYPPDNLKWADLKTGKRYECRPGPWGGFSISPVNSTKVLQWHPEEGDARKAIAEVAVTPE
jgi:hypothetical protein